MGDRPADIRLTPQTLIAFAGTVLALVVVIAWVDLTPRVEPDFFFAKDDPQLQISEQISRQFPSPPQLVLRAEAPTIESDAYRTTLQRLTRNLQQVDGVTGVNSIATDDPATSPLWQRLLSTPDGSATNVIVQVDDTDPRVLVPRIEAAIADFDASDVTLKVSGVPYVIELIRRSLLRDLVVFSVAAFAVFGAVVGLVYRRWQIAVGTLAACVAACCVTLIITQTANVAIGLLTANIAVIVFVLTLSHIVFITANWQRAQSVDGDAREAVRVAVRQTLSPSFWCMLTTLLGFLSLQIASAKPLRELGIAGAIGTLTALGIAYTVYPPFLRAVPARAVRTPRSLWTALARHFPTRNRLRWLAAIAGITIGTALGVPRVSTDPGLLSYFARGSEIREGLEAIDRDGGSSPLNLVVADAAGGRIDTDEAYDKMWRLQNALEADAAVGVTISPAVLLAHAKQAPLAGLLNWRMLLDIMESPLFNGIALRFVTPDREQALFFMRMRESDRREPRQAVVARIQQRAEESGLAVLLIGGQYQLQRELGQLIASSLRIGLGGLLTLFIIIAFVVSRSQRVAFAMLACLAAIPLFVIGTMGHAGAAIDIISSPAANVTLAMGVDSMIHLVSRRRRLVQQGASGWESWTIAREQLWRPILGATLIICAGFGIFALSTFPPTQRFGIAVLLGTLAAAVMALVALPFAATLGAKPPTSRPVS